MGDLKTYIEQQEVSRDKILRIRIRYANEDGPSRTLPLKEAVDYIPDGNSRVALVAGKWTHFNQDYLDSLDQSLRSIEVEPTEDALRDIVEDEGTFNVGALAYGYEIADKDFDILRTRSPTPVEAWDLKRDSRVYAVKFGTPQKLGYVVDQATAVLELLRNAASVKEVPDFSSYCLWFGYRAQSRLTCISESGSIILKQKVDNWARRARDLGLVPVLKYSQKFKPGYAPEGGSGK